MDLLQLRNYLGDGFGKVYKVARVNKVTKVSSSKKV